MRKHIFFIGIGGYGLSAIARLMHEKGNIVSGSDHVLSPLAIELRKLGINVYEGHSPDHIVGVDLVVRSSAIPDSNVEVDAARKAGIPVLKRSEFLGEVLEQHKGIAVGGTHGKTTTTAMISWLLAGLDQDPSYIIGGVSKNLGINAHAGKGEYFVIEADEYDRMFLGLKPFIEIITNMEHDHPDCYPTYADYFQAFLAFTKKINPQGFIVICGDDKGNQSLLPHLSQTRRFTYGLEASNDYQATDVTVNSNGGYSFGLNFHSPTDTQKLTQVELIVPGLHNVQNAMAALVIAHKCNLDLERSSRLLRQFTGTGRRFDIQGTFNGITLIDDYAHHPTEIKATLEAAKNKFPHQNLWIVWQPHTFTRTITLMDQFVKSFDQADHVIISEIFASREKNDSISSQQILTKMNHRDVRYIPAIPEIIEILSKELKSGDVLIVLSAGDADQINKILATSFHYKEGGQ
ncbi:MAG: UDP-N-acetylmuramate--L-alanine ligase [Anaerolineaceae bacterium]